MTSTVGLSVQIQPRMGERIAHRQLLTALAITAAVLFALLAMHLIVRRLSGAFVQPLSGPAIVVAAMALVTAASLLRRLAWQIRFPILSTHLADRNVCLTLLGNQYSVFSTRSRYLFFFPSIVAIAVLTTLTVPGTPVPGFALAWLVLIAGEATQGLVYFRPDLRRLWNIRRVSVAGSRPNSVAEEAEIPAGLVQQVTRVREADRESIHAILQAEIPSGDRLAVVHLSFCPPLAARPALTAHAVDAENAEVRLTQAETFGARIEVRLPEADAAPRCVMIEVLGTVTAPRSV